MIVEVNEQQFRTYMEENQRLVAFFHTPFCANCSYARRVVESVTKRLPFRVTVVSGDLNRMPSLAEPLNVMTVPLVVFIEEGKPVGSFTAFASVDQLAFEVITFLKSD